MTTSRQPSTGVGQDDDTQSVPVSAASDSAETSSGTDPARQERDQESVVPVDSLAVGPRAPGGPLDDDYPLPERRISTAAQRTGKVRKARLRLLRVEPWSVMKSAFVLSIAVGITFVVATATLWSIIDAAGVFEAVGGLIADLTESEGSTGLDVTDYVGFSRVVGLATVIAVVDVVLLTALATLFAFLYNLSAALLGGFEITLAEDD